MSMLYLSAAHKSSGKTTLSIGLTAALRQRGLRVQPFKKGPDYIDPMWLGLAAGRDCFNLDYHTMAPQEILASFASQASGADLCLLEGNVGLFDSVDPRGAHSNAELVKLLRVPLILVIDAKGMGRGIAPLLLGFAAFDPQLRIDGVILNRVGGERHAANLRQVVEYYTDLPVLGCLPRLPELDIAERHLGLVPSNEAEGAERKIDLIRARVAEHIDIDRVLAIAATAAPPEGATTEPAAHRPAPAGPSIRLGLARDAAFGFYYPDDLAVLAHAGAELIAFSPLHDAELPVVDALLLGGGFPEFHMDALAANRTMRTAVAEFVAAGKPVYAECGGLMYLCRNLQWQERVQPMCGVLAADVAMHAKPQGRGYVRLRETAAFPWPEALSRETTTAGMRANREIMAHEFHHSALVAADPGWVYAYEVLRGTGIDGQHDGIVTKGLLASYAHLRNVGGNRWTERFLAHIRRHLDA